MDFKAFMAGNALPVENKKVVISQRFIEDGKPAAWEIRALTNEEDDALREAHTRMVPAPGKAGKRGQMVPKLDSGAYTAAFAAQCVVFPNLDNAELQDSYHVKGAAALLRTMLTPGELNDLILEAQTHSGFDITLDDLVDEAKN